MTRDKARQAIRRLAKGPSENLYLSQHAKLRDPPRGKMPLLKQEIFTVLEHGWIVEGPTADNSVRGGWRVIVRRSSGEHREEVVGVLQPGNRMFVITGYADAPRAASPGVESRLSAISGRVAARTNELERFHPGWNRSSRRPPRT